MSVVECEIPGGWTEQEVLIGARRLRILLPADANAFLEHLDSLPICQGSSDPYWARLWPSAVTFANWIARMNWPAGSRILELGCGIGVPGLAAVAAGHIVTFSDYVPLAVQIAVENARRNGFSTMRGLVLDWNQTVDGEFDLLIGSDVLYDPDRHDSLLKVVDRLLAESGTCWIGDAGRYHVPIFIQRAVDRGFLVQLFDSESREIRQPMTAEYQLLRLVRPLKIASRAERAL